MPESARGAKLAAQLRAAAEALVSLISNIDDGEWTTVAQSGVWSPSKDAEHVADATLYHQWMVRLSLGERVGSRRPQLERAQRTGRWSRAEIIDVIRSRAEENAEFIASLSEAQLELPPRPPRARLRTVAELIEAVMIRHVDSHRQDIAAKLGMRLSGAAD
jgi:hypothetical protein